MEWYNGLVSGFVDMHSCGQETIHTVQYILDEAFSPLKDSMSNDIDCKSDDQDSSCLPDGEGN